MFKRISCIAVLAGSLAWGQQQGAQSESMPGMDMSGHDMSRAGHGATKEMAGMDSESGIHAMHSMEGHHMDVGPHMKMTALRSSKPADEERAGQVVDGVWPRSTRITTRR